MMAVAPPSLDRLVDVHEPTTRDVRDLIAAQFPEWAELPVTPVLHQGWDNRTFRLGEELSVRLPSAEGYAAAVAKEDQWLPHLSRHLRLPVPAPVAIGRPTVTFPLPWSVRRWLPGETLAVSTAVDPAEFAVDLAGFLRDLRAVPTEDGPAAGRQSMFRGCHPSAYSDDVRRALDELGDAVDRPACERMWAEAVDGDGWTGAPVWFHGDVAAGNLLVEEGRLSAVIDFGTCGVGDPACDLVMAWTWFDADHRHLFREAVDLPGDVWRRAHGWALWKALISLAGTPAPQEVHRSVIHEIITGTII